MHNSSLDLNLGQPSNSNNNYNINNNNNNSNLSISTSYSNDNECIFNCSNTQVLLISNNNNNNDTKTGRQMLAAQETKTAEENRENVQSANTTNSGGESERVIGRKPEEYIESAEQAEILRSTADGFRTRSGILVDESASYENDDATGIDRMQLNPSDDVGWDDEYDDDEEDEGDDEEDVDTEDVQDAYGDEDAAEEETRVDVIAQARRSDASFESLPEAKGLVQALVGDENESVKNMPNVGKAKSIAHIPSVSIVDAAVAAPTDEEEEDMGFDEDDERIAIIVERQRGGHQQANDNDKGFLNEEGSGAEANRYKNRFRLDYLEKYRKKLHMEHAHSRGGGITDGREGSGNFANDDDDDDDDDSDDNDDGDDDDNDDGVDADANDDADRQEGDNYFNTKHTKSSNRYFRKNTNDAIKIISTPLGKVGIVYQQTPNEEDGNSKKPDAGDKKPTSFTDFDALSPDPESSHRLASSHPKITPVLTPDGKVALLYRGDSENSKYEPIRNLTHKFSNNKNEFSDNKASDTINKDTPDFQSNDGSENESADASDDDDDDDYDLDSASNSNEHTNSRKTGGAANPTDETQKAAIQNPATDADAADPASGSGGSFIIRPTDSVLPMINRPLSEVLGIKKNQFKQIRIKDHPTAPPNAAAPGAGGGGDGAFAAGDPRSLAGTSIDRAIDTTTLHFLTKVNLAEYPTSMKTRNFDFDFSRDNTMLDERRRYKEHQLHQQQQQQQQGGAGGATGTNNNYPSGLDVGNNNNNKLNEEVLAKTEVVNLAIIPHFDEELERLQRLRELETRRHYRQRYRQRPSEEDLSGIHCIMQAMMGIAAISTVFGMLGTFFKQRILDQIRLMHW